MKLREIDKKKLDKLRSTIIKVKGKASKSEVLGLSLSFAEKNLDQFIATGLVDLKNEPVLDLIRKPASGQKTNAKKVKEYLYG